jgi:hypothetical protein
MHIKTKIIRYFIEKFKDCQHLVENGKFLKLKILIMSLDLFKAFMEKKFTTSQLDS